MTAILLVGPFLLLLGYLVLAGRMEWWPPGRLAAFAGGLGIVASSTLINDALLPLHMFSHGVVVSLGAMLLVLGRPITLILRSLSPQAGRRVVRILRWPGISFLVWPPFAVTFFIAVQLVFHLTPLFDLALTNGVAHAIEHALFLFSALLFWSVTLAVEPLPHRWSPYSRAVLLLVAMPFSDLGAVRLMLDGNALAGAAMVAAMMPIGFAGMAVLWSGFDTEERRARRNEELLRERPEHPVWGASR